jgi:hypothetical protein
MEAFILMAAIYVGPFLVLGIATKRSVARRYIALSDVQARGIPHRKLAPFSLGIWRND